MTDRYDTDPYRVRPQRNYLATAIYNFLNPIALGCFAGAMIFDVMFAFYSTNFLWNAGAAWLLFFGVIIAIIPRFINLFQVFMGFDKGRGVMTSAKLGFWINLVMVILVVFNCFVHARDNYATQPDGVILSIITVVLMLIAAFVEAADKR